MAVEVVGGWERGGSTTTTARFRSEVFFLGRAWGLKVLISVGPS
jgi:hypothetical protein